MPLDLSAEEVDSTLLDTPINTSPTIDLSAQDAAVSAVLSALKASKHPAIIIDALVQRYNATSETHDFVTKVNVPFFTANMGKAVVDEDHEMYVGVWNGAVGTPGVKEAAHAADLVITLGYVNADTNSGGFSRILEDDKTIHINPFEVTVSYESKSS